jgi:hypothetical protein
MNQNGIELQVLVEGKPVREFGCEGRTIVEGRKGFPFSVKVKNNHPIRVHAVVLVDGVSVVSGTGKIDNGYILEPYSAYEIKGWRKSLNDIASFVFETTDKSYTKAVKGTSAQCGVISVVAYSEKQRVIKQVVEVEKHIHHHEPYYWGDPWYYPRPYRQPIVMFSSTDGCLGSNGPAGCNGMSLGSANQYSAHSVDLSKMDGLSASAYNVSSASPEYQTTGKSQSFSSSSMNLGTAWGASQVDAVRETHFENGPVVATMELYYTDSKGLKKLGIEVSKAPALAKTSGFPTGLTGFCQPPTFEYAGEPVVVGKSKKKR